MLNLAVNIGISVFSPSHTNEGNNTDPKLDV